MVIQGSLCRFPSRLRDRNQLQRSGPGVERYVRSEEHTNEDLKNIHPPVLSKECNFQVCIHQNLFLHPSLVLTGKLRAGQSYSS